MRYSVSGLTVPLELLPPPTVSSKRSLQHAYRYSPEFEPCCCCTRIGSVSLGRRASTGRLGTARGSSATGRCSPRGTCGCTGSPSPPPWAQSPPSRSCSSFHHRPRHPARSSWRWRPHSSLALCSKGSPCSRISSAWDCTLPSSACSWPPSARPVLASNLPRGGGCPTGP